MYILISKRIQNVVAIRILEDFSAKNVNENGTLRSIEKSKYIYII